MNMFKIILFRVLRMLILALILIGLFLVFGLPYMENKMIYFPMAYPEGYWDTSPFPGNIEDCAFRAADGVELHGWFAHALGAADEKRPTLLFFHGNAGNITHRLSNVAYLVQLGVNVFIFDYRGYGKSEGRPDEQGLYADALAAYDYLLARDDVQKEQIIFFGRSLGGAVAVELASQKPCEKLILESTFTSIKEMSKEMFAGFPLHYFVRTKFDSLSKIPRIQVPLLLLHGNRDSVVPFRHGKSLFAAANTPKDFYEIEGAGHNDTYEIGGNVYFERLSRFIHGDVR